MQLSSSINGNCLEPGTTKYNRTISGFSISNGTARDLLITAGELILAIVAIRIDKKDKNCILQPATDISTARDIAGRLLKLRTLNIDMMKVQYGSSVILQGRLSIHHYIDEHTDD